MKNLITLAFMAGLAAMAACSSEDSTGGTGGAAGAASGGGGTGGGTGGAATGGTGGSATGGTGGSSTGGMAGMPGDGGTGDCNACTSKECAAEVAACEANADCKKLLDCVGACADDACVTKCIQDNPTGVTAFGPVTTCASTKCKVECGL